MTAMCRIRTNYPGSENHIPHVPIWLVACFRQFYKYNLSMMAINAHYSLHTWRFCNRVDSVLWSIQPDYRCLVWYRRRQRSAMLFHGTCRRHRPVHWQTISFDTQALQAWVHDSHRPVDALHRSTSIWSIPQFLCDLATIASSHTISQAL